MEEEEEEEGEEEEERGGVMSGEVQLREMIKTERDQKVVYMRWSPVPDKACYWLKHVLHNRSVSDLVQHLIQFHFHCDVVY